MIFMCKGSGAKLMKSFSPQTGRICTAGGRYCPLRTLSLEQHSVLCAKKVGWNPRNFGCLLNLGYEHTTMVSVKKE